MCVYTHTLEPIRSHTLHLPLSPSLFLSLALTLFFARVRSSARMPNLSRTRWHSHFPLSLTLVPTSLFSPPRLILTLIMALLWYSRLILRSQVQLYSLILTFVPYFFLKPWQTAGSEDAPKKAIRKPRKRSAQKVGVYICVYV